MKPTRLVAVLAHPATLAIAAVPLVAAVEHRREVATRLLFALPLGWATSKALKRAYPRQKPRLLSLTPRQSFPSGHLAASTAFAASLVDAYRAWRAAPVAAAVLGLAGASRVHDREHRVSEVLAGVAIGLGAAILAAFAARYLERVA
jgi:membrane-associated phospholipid phosphatase